MDRLVSSPEIKVLVSYQHRKTVDCSCPEKIGMTLSTGIELSRTRQGPTTMNDDVVTELYKYPKEYRR